MQIINNIRVDDNELMGLKETLANPVAVAEVRAKAEAKRRNPKPFDSKAFKEYIHNHPYFSYLSNSDVED